jgi:hypothetical protein
MRPRPPCSMPPPHARPNAVESTHATKGPRTVCSPPNRMCRGAAARAPCVTRTHRALQQQRLLLARRKRRPRASAPHDGHGPQPRAIVRTSCTSCLPSPGPGLSYAARLLPAQMAQRAPQRAAPHAQRCVPQAHVLDTAAQATQVSSRLPRSHSACGLRYCRFSPAPPPSARRHKPTLHAPSHASSKLADGSTQPQAPRCLQPGAQCA